MNLKYQQRRGANPMTDDQKRELKSYHNKGMDYKEVALKMGMPAKRVKDKAHKMGVSLNSRKRRANDM